MLPEELTKGALLFKLGKSYKECTNSEELNQYFKEERQSKCGFLNKVWNKMGNSCGNQIILSVPENRKYPYLFCGEQTKIN